jgi:hypothetical protein
MFTAAPAIANQSVNAGMNTKACMTQGNSITKVVFMIVVIQRRQEQFFENADSSMKRFDVGWIFCLDDFDDCGRNPLNQLVTP